MKANCRLFLNVLLQLKLCVTSEDRHRERAPLQENISNSMLEVGLVIEMIGIQVYVQFPPKRTDNRASKMRLSL